MAAHFTVRWRRPRRALSLPELNTYPAAPIVSEPPSAWLAPEVNRVKFKRKLQQLPELDVYPSAAITPDMVAWLRPPTFRTNFRRKHLTVEELNTYPQTPAAFYEGWYPGSALAESFRVGFKRTLQTLPELNSYPVAVTPATLQAYIEQPSFRWKFKRNHLELPELNQYPPTPAGLGIGLRSGITDKGQSINSLITSDGNGVLSSMDDTQGLSSKFSSDGTSVFSIINSDGQGVETEL